MSYEDEIKAMQGHQVEPAPFETLAGRTATEPRVPRARVSIASVATVGAGLAFGALFLRPLVGVDVLGGERIQLQVAALLPLFVLVWALRRLSRPQLGAQLLCRAVWWSSLVVGLLVSLNYGETPDKVLGAIIAVASAVALLSVGERGLDVQDPDSPFAPVRFRGHLLLALVMAAADALTLAFSGLLQLRVGMRGWNLLGTIDYAGPTIAAAIVMGIAVWGVYRLRTWALLLNLVANIAIAYLALEGTLRLSPSVSVSLATTAAVQCFIPVPILAAALGDRNSGQPLLQSVRHRLMTYTIVVLAFSSVLAIVMSGGDGWVDGPGRAFIRGTRKHVVRTVYGGNPRKRLGAESNDLRGRSFDRKALEADFSGVDFRGASLRSTNLWVTTLDGADLRNADFTKADFGGGQVLRPGAIRYPVTAKGATVHGADFTGAQVREDTWRQLAARGLEGVRCPDGTLAAAAESSGCDGHLGYVPKGTRHVFRFAQTSTEGSVACGREDNFTVAFEDGGLLRHRGDRYVQLANGDFASRFSDIHVLDDGRWEVSSELCGDNILIPADDEALEEPPPSQ